MNAKLKELDGRSVTLEQGVNTAMDQIEETTEEAIRLADRVSKLEGAVQECRDRLAASEHVPAVPAQGPDVATEVQRQLAQCNISQVDMNALEH